MAASSRSKMVGAVAVGLALVAGGLLATPAAGVSKASDMADGRLPTALEPPPGVGPGVIVQTPGEALDQDLGLVAKAAGWTIEQSRAQHLAAEAVSRVAQELAATRPDIFVGSALADEPGGPPALYVKGPADARVRALVEAAGSPIEVVDRQPFSFTELEERSRAVHDHLVRLGFDNLSTGFRIEGRGEITAAVTAREGLPRRAADIVASFPAHLIRGSTRLSVSMTPVVAGEHAYGGMQVAGTDLCTSGWSVYTPTGTTGVTTAGHCRGIDQITEPGVGVWALSHQREHRGEWGDVEWHTSVHSEPAQFYSEANVVRRTVALESRAGINKGEWVCGYGRVSNARGCAKVVDLSRSCTADGVTVGRIVTTDRFFLIGGDSGGGWSYNTTAFGSHYGDCGIGEAFSVAELFDQALGVRVRIAHFMPPGVTLHENDRLVSTDGRFTAIMQLDGNFVIYQSGVGAIWATGTNGNANARLVMQLDGNLVIYRANNTPAWATGTSGSGHFLLMQTDGNLVMYRPGSGAVWASGTCCR